MMQKILVHICCAVDSHYFLQKLQLDYPQSKLIGYFYDPNIHPYSEYKLRLLETQRSCKMLGIELIEGEYDFDGWRDAVVGLENEPEKGARCSICFDRRFDFSALKASEIGADFFTSTLLTSPKKSLQQLKVSGENLAKKYNIEFLAPDYRKKSGTQEQNIMAKDAKLYRQDYCGCIYGLTMQRDAQNQLADELFSSMSNQILPASIESKLELYEKRISLEERGIKYKIVRDRFLNYRLLYGILKVKGIPVVSHILPYSTLKKSFTRGKIDYSANEISYLSRDQAKFITLEHYNKITDSSYANMSELICNPPAYDAEISARGEVVLVHNDISTIIVTEQIPIGKIEIYINSELFEDTVERIVQIQ